MKRLSYSVGFFSCILIFIFSLEARSDALGMFGASSRSTAMGGAMVGIAQGTEALYYNPSAIALGPDATSLQIRNLDAKLYINEYDYGSSGLDNIVGFSQRFVRDRIGVGLLMPLSMGGGEGEFDPGTGFQLPVGTLLGEVSSLGWPMYGSPTIPMYMGLSFRLHDTLAVGIHDIVRLHGLLMLSDITLDLDAILEGLLGLPLSGSGEPPTEVSFNLHVGVGSESQPIGYSATFRPIKYLSFGYSKSPQSAMDLWIPIVIKSGLLETDMIMILVSNVETQPEVERMGLGVHIPLPHSELILAYSQDAWKFHDLYEDRYDEWKHYERELRISGGEQSISWPSPSPRDNVTIQRYGLEYLLDIKGWVPDFLSKRNPKCALRAGYFHWDSPYDEDILWGGDFDSDADVYSGGIGFNFDKMGKAHVADPSESRWMSIDIHYQYFEVDDRDYTKSYDDWGNPRGPSSLYYYHTQADIVNFGIQLTWWH